jgi:hypothetical protein
LLVTAFIVYGSLYPWQFHAATIPGNPLLILLGSWNVTFNRYFFRDISVNVMLYVPFGLSCYLCLARRALAIRLALPVVLALLLSSGIEMVQLYDAQRNTSMVDVVTNVAGCVIGVALATRFRTAIHLRPATGPPLFLLFCWTAALLFPFMPDLSTTHLLHKIGTFTAPPFFAVPFINLTIMWLVAARLMEAAAGRVALPFLLLVLPARLFISGLTLAWTDCLPALFGLAIYFLLPRRDLLLGGCSLAAILLVGLAPFHFSPVPQSFSWIPFRALLSTDWESGVAIFFRKSFAYGSTIWLFTSGGLPILASAIGVSSVLAALEGVQLWLPNHVAECTDPLHALLLAAIFRPLRKPLAYAPGSETHLSG